MSYPSFLMKLLLALAHTVWDMPEEYWIDDSPRLRDTELLEEQAAGESNIDDMNLRSEMVAKWRKGEVVLRVKELPGRTRVVFLGTDAQWSQIPWVLWAKLFQAIGHPVGHVLFYAHPLLRNFPENPKKPIEAKNINAGYSFICEQQVVVIYRFEEATRVLLHELLHTACFDKGLPVELLEANTEAWTEVFLCAILSKGIAKRFKKLWSQQCAWIEAQTRLLRETWSVKGPSDYAWRYTIGRHEVLIKKGFMMPGSQISGPVGLRFTTPEWDSYIF